MQTFEKYPVRRELADRFEAMVSMRRDLHRHPELGFQEVRTAGVVTKGLEQAGLAFRAGIAKTGVATLVPGSGRSGRTVLFRADMDALPIREESAVEYRSVHEDTMHACGHDGHTTILLHTLLEAHAGAARPTVDVKYVFQPAEEGPGGAKPMIEEGVLLDPKVEAAFGLHLWNTMPAGKVAVTSGPFMAAADEFEIRITGVGGHAAYPHEAVDPVVIGAHVVVALQTLVSRNADPTKTAVVSIGSFHGGSAFNVLPEEVRMRGTLRTFDDELRTLLIRRLREVVVGTAGALGGRAELDFIDGYPTTVNDPRMAEFVREIACEVVGAENVLTDLISMGGEDMSYFLREVPGCYFFLGSQDRDRGLDAAHHNPRFDFDEGVMPIGAEIFLRIQDRYLERFPEPPGQQ
ncbi:MAG: M20 family metallopeptidase [Candidatus Eisenbacteria bacterium]